jgi:aminoglycoside phosphotransferase (APT) family kinase protein
VSRPEDGPDPELLPLDVVGPLLAEATGERSWLDVTASMVAGGKSNLTFELSSNAGRLILRRPPSGELLATAHDMGREVRVQRALAGTSVPVPEILLFDEGSTIGVPFYVMTKVDGHVVRGELPVGFATTEAERHRLGLRLVEVLAEVHAVSPDEVGLADFGRPEGFLARQLRRWRRQWELSQDEPVPAIDILADMLQRVVPASPGATVLHGDYRLDNCVVSAADPGEIRAVLDWEMSTLGDPLTDLGMLLFYWVEPGEPGRVLSPTVTSINGFPDRAELVQHYAERTGRDLRGLWFYEAFAHFKFAVIAQGISARVKAGAMAGQDFGDLRQEVRRVAEAGLSIAAEHVALPN